MKAKKVRQRCGEVFRYAIVTGRAIYNPAPDLASAMQGHEAVHSPFLKANELRSSLMPLILIQEVQLYCWGRIYLS